MRYIDFQDNLISVHLVFTRRKSNLNPIFVVGECSVWQANLHRGDDESFQWTMFDPEKKKMRREEVFPKHKQAAYEMGRKMTAKSEKQ
jgi:hypothetical protein